MLRSRSLALLLPLTWKIIGSYVVFSLLWIILTDRILERLFTDAASLGLAQSAKGVVFIAATASLLAVLVFRLTGKLLVFQIERTNTQKALLQAQSAAKLGSFAWDMRLGHLATSPGLVRLLGLDQAPVDLDALVRALPEPLRQPVNQAIHQAQQFLEPLQLELSTELSPEVTLWFRFQVEPVIEQGELIGLRGLLQDQTESKRTEQVLQEALERVQASDRIKTNFLHNLNHELRTPMNGVVGMSQVLQDMAPKSMTPGLQVIYQSGQAMTQLLDSILDLQRMLDGGRQPVAEPVDLYSLARQTDKLFRPSAEVKGLGLELQIDPDLPQWVNTDPYLLHQILTHLVANAIKFTDQGRVRLALGVDQGWMQLAVEDTGVGIAPDQQDRIFERFAQVDESLTRAYEGLGAGLAVVREFTELLGGEILLESQPGQGSTFILRLPLEETQPPEEGLSMTLLPIRNVLVADDDKTAGLLLEMMLASRNCQVQIVADGQSALDLFAQGGVELVVLDLMMPGIDGLEVARRIRDSEKDRGAEPVRLVALTALTRADIPQRCKEAGFDLCLSKPLTMADLDLILEQHPESLLE